MAHDLPFYGRLCVEVCKQIALEALSMGASRVRGHVVHRMFRGRVPVSPVQRWDAAIRRRAPAERRVLKRWFGKPVDSVQSRESNLPPQGLAGVKAKRVLVFHLADKAGPHLECYLEYEGVAYNVGVKRLSRDVLLDLGLRRNGGGWLTQGSQQRLIDFWQQEFQVSRTAWLAQSTDHRPHEARMAWGERERGVVGYGAGELRQVLDECEVVLHTTGKSVEWHDPMLDRHRKAFAFKSIPKTEQRPSNILGVGLKENPAPPAIEKLKLIFHRDLAKFQRLVGPDGIYTIKDDGASVKFRSGPKGTNFWSPRMSKVTGAHIMYDGKVRDWVAVTTPETVEGMGEFLAYQQAPNYWWLSSEWQHWLRTAGVLRWTTPLVGTKRMQLSAADVGGLLNASAPIPDDIDIQLRLYLISRVGRQRLEHEDYAHNYERVVQTARLHPDWEPVIRIAPSQVPWFGLAEGIEGLVGVPAGASLVEGGYKLKVRGDHFDWRVVNVDLRPGANGGVAGVVWFVSLESDRQFKMGGGPLGPMDRRLDMMQHPEKYEGRVFEVACFEGHEGRAAHIVREHPDKGVA